MQEIRLRPRPIIMGALVLLISFLAFQRTHAQSDAVSVVIVRPGEGETIYAGPVTMLYSTHVTGWVHVGSGHPNQVEVKLEIIDGASMVASHTTRPGETGKFEISVTVNPDKSSEELTDGLSLDRNSGCQSECHYGASIALPPGELLLRVTATTPSGRRAIAERHITVDHAGHATLPVQLSISGDVEGPVAGVPVSAATRLYLWRARHASGITNAEGRAMVDVEALSEAPTNYLLKVEPTVVDGVLYESVSPVVVTVPPGGVSADLASLQVISSLGTIEGQLTRGNRALEGVTIEAIHLADATVYRTQTDADGSFTLAEVPFSSYLLLVDPQSLDAQQVAVSPQKVDLLSDPAASATLTATALPETDIQGVIHGQDGDPLPFSWVSVQDTNLSQETEPDSGRFILRDVPDGQQTIIVSAPGHYSQARAIDSPMDSSLTLELERNPKTQSLVWGEGEIIIPPESVVNVSGHNIQLERGRLWGSVSGDDPAVIEVEDVTIRIEQGRFAIEKAPGNLAVLYQFSGQAELVDGDGAEPTVVGEDQMVILSKKRIGPTALNTTVVEALYPELGSPAGPVWEPDLVSLFRDRLAMLGINSAQVITFITYMTVLIFIVAVPAFALFWQLKKRVDVPV